MTFSNINKYYDRRLHRNAAKLLPGEYYVTTEDEIITTVLGSCVSACIRDKKLNIGGMNHFMLPIKSGKGHCSWDAHDNSLPTRYGNFAMEHLINDILKLGSKRSSLEIKLFGGGRVIRNSGLDIGDKNISFIRSYLLEEKFEIICEDLGGNYPRKIIYDPITGDVLVKKLKDMHNNTIEQRELEYMSTITDSPQDGDIELFD